MKKFFPCQRCEISQGHEQPAYVREDAESSLQPGVCLVNSDTRAVPIKCTASHSSTYRLCSCS